VVIGQKGREMKERKIEFEEIYSHPSSLDRMRSAKPSLIFLDSKSLLLAKCEKICTFLVAQHTSERERDKCVFKSNSVQFESPKQNVNCEFFKVYLIEIWLWLQQIDVKIIRKEFPPT
jgi:hypothetical protein